MDTFSFAQAMRAIGEESGCSHQELVALRRRLEQVYRSAVYSTLEHISTHALECVRDGRSVSWLLKRSNTYWRKRVSHG